MPRSYYLPEIHDFEYIARAPWPLLLTADDQLDWVNAVDCMELWLNRFCGPHYQEWAFHNDSNIQYWTACIAFRRERNKTLFLLQWT